MTRNGKIARLPKAVREQLNRRLDNNEQGISLVEWLNSLPEVQKATASEFDGKPIREQNLSEWKKGGYRDWQARQERQELVSQLEEEAKDLGAVIDHRAINRNVSIVLTAELAKALRDLREQNLEPRELAECLTQLAGKLAQLRREESNASRAEIVRERWNREVEKEEQQNRACGALMPLQALFLQQLYIDMFSRSNGRALTAAVELAADLQPDVPPSPIELAETQSE